MRVILNPQAGNGRLHRQVAAALEAAGLNYEICLTERRGHATELAAEARRHGYKTVVAAGGDGTINEVVNGLLSVDAAAGDAVTLGVLPIGTGNDLARALNLPTDIADACQRLTRNKSQQVDIGEVNGHYFINNAAFGFEPTVTLMYDRMAWLSGPIRYVVAALRALIAAKQWQADLQWDGGSYQGSINLVSVGNGCRAGGLFYLTPDARPDDGLLNMAFDTGLSKAQLIAMLPKTFKPQRIEQAQVRYETLTTLTARVSPPTPIHADGEIIAQAATDITYKLHPQRLRVII